MLQDIYIKVLINGLVCTKGSPVGFSQEDGENSMCEGLMDESGLNEKQYKIVYSALAPGHREKLSAGVEREACKAAWIQDGRPVSAPPESLETLEVYPDTELVQSIFS